MSWKKVEKDIGKGPFGVMKWFVFIVLFLSAFFGVLNAIGLVGGKVVERAVLKNSFQYVEGMEQRAAILQANIDEINILLSQNPQNKDALTAQRLILQSQLRAITINK